MKRQGFVANSSSSSFICENKAGFTIERTREILQTMWGLHSEIYKEKYPDNEYYPKTFNDAFDEPSIVKKNESPGLYRFYMVEWRYEKEQDWRFKSLGIKTEEDFAGKLIINSAGDNTIPHELFELIEFTFDGYRIHLG